MVYHDSSRIEPWHDLASEKSMYRSVTFEQTFLTRSNCLFQQSLYFFLIMSTAFNARQSQLERPVECTHPLGDGLYGGGRMSSDVKRYDAKILSPVLDQIRIHHPYTMIRLEDPDQNECQPSISSGIIEQVPTP